MTLILRRALQACLCLLLFLHTVHAIKWLALSNSKNVFWNQTRHCIDAKRNHGLKKHQVRICRENLEMMSVIMHASREAVQVCQQLFSASRWNCSSLNFAPNYLADLTGGSREQAFVFALSSASLTQSVGKACAIGATTKCGCGRMPSEAPPGDFKWGGCGDDLFFGIEFSRIFADGNISKRKRISKRAAVDVHNNAAGRKIVQDSLSTACKCHGVSGSCSIKTCWKALPDIKAIGAELQKRYAIAIEVDNKRVGKKKAKTRKLVPVNRHVRSFDAEDLIYFTKSPDYCLPDTTLGSLGTRGRDCRKEHSGSDGCRSMCCGRGYTSKVIEMKQRCDCKYYWCCYVKCKTCTKKVEINRCR